MYQINFITFSNFIFNVRKNYFIKEIYGKTIIIFGFEVKTLEMVLFASVVGTPLYVNNS